MIEGDLALGGSDGRSSAAQTWAHHNISFFFLFQLFLLWGCFGVTVAGGPAENKIFELIAQFGKLLQRQIPVLQRQGCAKGSDRWVFITRNTK